jgi:hypothetical protein
LRCDVWAQGFFAFGALLLLPAACSCKAASRSPPAAEDTSRSLSLSVRLTTIARRCARIASCAHPHDSPSFRDPGACVDFWLTNAQDPKDPLATCLSAALTCEGVEKCLHPFSASAAARYCRDHPGHMTDCDGTRLVVCGGDDPDESTEVDCASLGAKCATLARPGGLTTHACADSTRCPEDLTRSACDGAGAVLSCHEGAVERVVCKAGSVCQAHTEGDGEQVAMCEAPGHVSCSTPGSRRCEGSRLVRCEAHGHFGHENAVDCASLALSCSGRDGEATCTDGPPECVGDHASCEGNALSFCAAGKRFHIDCGEIGLGVCEADGRGPEAACKPQK